VRAVAPAHAVPMTTPRELIENLFAVIDDHRWDEFPSVIAEDCVFTSPFGVCHGPGEWAAFSQGFAVAVPDGRHVVDHVLAEGDAIGFQGTWIGTNTGPLQLPAGAAPASGASVALRYGAIARVRDGKVTRMDAYLDQVEFLSQLGLMPQPATA